MAVLLAGALSLSAAGAAVGATPAHSAASTGGLTRRERWLIAMVIVDLGVLAYRGGWFDPASRRRASLYEDTPTDGVAPPGRTTKAPPLR